MSASGFVKHAAFYAGPESVSNVAIYVVANVIIFIPALIGAAKNGNTQVGVQFIRFVSSCKIGSSMVDSFTIVCPHIVPYFFHAIASCHSREGFGGIVFIPPVRPEKVRNFLMLPSMIELGVHAAADFPIS